MKEGNIINLRVGFPIFSPAILVSWGLSEPELIELFKSTTLRRVAKWFYVIDCEPLEGLHCSVAIQIDGDYGVCELQLWGIGNADLRESYVRFQSHLEKGFGSPSQTEKIDTDFPSHAWIATGARVSHFVRDRYGPEERVIIARVYSDGMLG